MRVPKLEIDPWEDQDCINAFIERNAGSFLDFCVGQDVIEGFEDSVLTNTPMSLKYCEKRMSSFLDFADNYYAES